MVRGAVCLITVQSQRTAKKSVPTPNTRKRSLSRSWSSQSPTPGVGGGGGVCTQAEAAETVAGRAARKPACGLGGVPAQGRRAAE